METLCEFSESRFEIGNDRELRECGLIAEQDMPYFEVLAPEEEGMALFDRLSELTRGGWVDFRGKIVKADHYMENGNEIRSVVEYAINREGNLGFVTSNLILHRNGKYYLEVHPGFIDEAGNVCEPLVGSPDVSQGPHGAVVIHYQVAYEASPERSLLQVA